MCSVTEILRHKAQAERNVQVWFRETFMRSVTEIWGREALAKCKVLVVILQDMYAQCNAAP